jgi:hypothetical protein
MDMVIHHGEVKELETELFLGFFDKLEKHSLDFRAMQGHGVMVGFCGHIVCGPDP